MFGALSGPPPPPCKRIPQVPHTPTQRLSVFANEFTWWNGSDVIVNFDDVIFHCPKCSLHEVSSSAASKKTYLIVCLRKIVLV